MDVGFPSGGLWVSGACSGPGPGVFAFLLRFTGGPDFGALFDPFVLPGVSITARIQ